MAVIASPCALQETMLKPSLGPSFAGLRPAFSIAFLEFIISPLKETSSSPIKARPMWERVVMSPSPMEERIGILG